MLESFLKNKIKYLLLSFIIVGCNDSIVDEEWQKVKFSEYSHTPIDSINISKTINYPDEILRMDSLIIIKDVKCDSIYKVFSLPNFDYHGWFGNIGKGPNELLLTPQKTRIYRNSIQISGLKKILIIDLLPANVYSNDNFKVLSKHIVPGYAYPLNEAFLFNDNKFYGIVFGGARNNMNDRKELVYFENTTNNRGTTIQFPKSIYNKYGAAELLYHKAIVVSKDNDKIAFFYHKYPLIRIFDKEMRLQKEIWVEELPKQIEFENLHAHLSSGKKSNLIYSFDYYAKAISTNIYIYAMYVNTKGMKSKSGNFEYKLEQIGDPELHVFNWEGKALFKTKLQKGTLAIEISEDGRYLYATNKFINNKIYYYDLIQGYKDANIELK